MLHHEDRLERTKPARFLPGSPAEYKPNFAGGGCYMIPLNLVEGFFSKTARSMLRHIRVASKVELKARILAYLDDINRDPVIHR